MAEGVQKVAKGLLQYGVTSFCPTVVTSPKEDYQKVYILILFYLVMLFSHHLKDFYSCTSAEEIRCVFDDI